jgi:hypothetical protein
MLRGHNRILARGYQIKEELREVLHAPDRAAIEVGLRSIPRRTGRHDILWAYAAATTRSRSAGTRSSPWPTIARLSGDSKPSITTGRPSSAAFAVTAITTISYASRASCHPQRRRHSTVPRPPHHTAHARPEGGMIDHPCVRRRADKLRR